MEALALDCRRLFAPAAVKHERKKDGFLYVITNPAFPGVVKVGKSRDPEARVAAANTWCPLGSFSVDALVYFPDVGVAERTVHQRLGAYRKSGEWFEVTVAHAFAAIDSVKFWAS